MKTSEFYLKLVRVWLFCTIACMGSLSLIAQSIISSKTQCKVMFTCETSSDISISLVDIAGKTIRSLDRQKFQAGKQTVDINLEGIPEGVYLVKVLNNEQSFHQKLVISKR